MKILEPTITHNYTLLPQLKGPRTSCSVDSKITFYWLSQNAHFILSPLILVGDDMIVLEYDAAKWERERESKREKETERERERERD